MAKEWAALKAVIKLHEPKFFGENEKGVPLSENEGLFHWACNFITSRAFGTVLGGIWLCPVIDSVNHEIDGQTIVDVVHTKLHLAQNKIYMHEPNFLNLIKRARLTSTTTSSTADLGGEDTESQVDLEKMKMINSLDLFRS